MLEHVQLTNVRLCIRLCTVGVLELLRAHLNTSVADMAIPAAQAHMSYVRNGSLRVDPLKER
jgi:hypothetical protein